MATAPRPREAPGTPGAAATSMRKLEGEAEMGMGGPAAEKEVNEEHSVVMCAKKSRSIYYGEHGEVGFVGEGEQSAFTTFTTSASFQGDFNSFKTGMQHKHLLRERGGRAVCQKWGRR